MRVENFYTANIKVKAEKYNHYGNTESYNMNEAYYNWQIQIKKVQQQSITGK